MDLEKAYQAYIKWRSHPREKNEPQNNEEFCIKYSITPKDLISFINRETYQDDLLISSLNWAKSKTPELLHIVYNEVKQNRNVADLERFMHLTHEIKKKDKDSKANNNFYFFANLKDEQYRDIAIREARILSDGSETPLS